LVLGLWLYILSSIAATRREAMPKAKWYFIRVLGTRVGAGIGGTARRLEGEVVVILHFWENVWLDTY
jgi:hypothetical protein